MARGGNAFDALADNFQGLVVVAVTMIVGAIIITETADVSNLSIVDNIRDSILGAFETGAGLVVVLILALIGAFALFYMQGMGGSSKTKGA